MSTHARFVRIGAGEQSGVTVSINAGVRELIKSGVDACTTMLLYLAIVVLSSHRFVPFYSTFVATPPHVTHPFGFAVQANLLD